MIVLVNKLEKLDLGRLGMVRKNCALLNQRVLRREKKENSRQGRGWDTKVSRRIIFPKRYSFLSQKFSSFAPKFLILSSKSSHLILQKMLLFCSKSSHLLLQKMIFKRWSSASSILFSNWFGFYPNKARKLRQRFDLVNDDLARLLI